MSDPYRGTVPVDVDAVKEREAAAERLAKMTPLERARMVYENMSIAATPKDPEKRKEALAQFQRARETYFRLLAESQRR